MSKKINGFLKKALCYAVMTVMVFTFMPLTTQVSAASFNADKQVTGLAVSSVGYNYVKLQWDSFSGAEGYSVYRATSQDGDYKLQEKTSKTTYKNTGTTNKTYYYKVRAYKVVNGKKTFSKYSSIVSGKPVLKAPVVLVSLATAKVKLSWDKVSGATGYQVLRATSRDGDFKSIGKTKSHVFYNTKLTKNKIYYYKVRAYRVVNGKTYYGPYKTIMQGITKLPAPGSVSVTTTETGLKVSWDSVSKATGYAVYRSTSENGTYTKITTTTSAQYSDNSLTKGAKYYYKVRAYINLNESTYYGTYSAAKGKTFTMPAPTVTVEPQDSSVKLTWTKVDEATGYQVYRATSKTGSYTKMWETTNLSYNNTKVDRDTVYYYKVRAIKTSGSATMNGSYCSPVGGTTILSAPTSVKAKNQSNSIKLTWKATPNASGYKIYRSTERDGTYKEVGSTSGTSFTDSTSLVKGTSYFYKIRGYIALNNVIYYGNYSNPSSSASRDNVVSVAVGWLGCKEPNGHKPIIDVYNSNLAPGCGKLSYKVAWCAAYVSAVGIKANATDIIVRHSYCPTMRSTYIKKDQYTSDKYYSPRPGDIIFFDWNKNNVPDHVGMIVSCEGNLVTTIEGNKSNAVGNRQFNRGYSLVLGYGLPPYEEASAITYTGTGNSAAVDALQAAGIGCGEEPDGYSEMGEDYDEAEEILSVGCSDESKELDQMKYIIETMEKTADTSNLEDVSKSEYLAAFIYRLCDEADIEACIVTEEDDNGNMISWVEATLDGKLYKVDPSQPECKPVRYTPEVTDYDGDVQ